MGENLKLVKGKMSKAQKIRFFKFAIHTLTIKCKGLCGIYRIYFSRSPNDFEHIPELQKYKPKNKFYNYCGESSEFSNQFWFPVNDNVSRINICKKILVELKSK